MDKAIEGFVYNTSFIIPMLICLVVGGICWFIMSKVEKRFLTVGRVRQSFNILDLQFSPSEDEFKKLLSGVDNLSRHEAKSSKEALTKYLYLDFLLMPAVYLFIVFLCFTTADYMMSFGFWLFVILGLLQIVPWACDVAENWFILGRINSDQKSTKFFNVYRALVFIKWGVAGFVLAAALSVLVYFWMSGRL